MNWRRPQVWLALISACAVLTLAVVDNTRTAPGPLTAVHDRVEELAGRRDCSECHGGFWGQSMKSACLDCHVEIEQQLDGDRGLHGTLEEELAGSCALCHSEHHGANFAIVNRQSFAMAGVPDPDVFDHSRLGFAIDGAHLELDCTACHTNAAVAVLPPGEKRYLGLDRNCASCHEDPHEGQMQPACSACHGQEDFTVLRSEGHERHLPLVGGHGDQDCRTCHAEGDAHALEAMGPGRKVAARTCQDCHDSPHASPFLEGVARAEQKIVGASCSLCHLAEHLAFDEETIEVSPALHAAGGFSLAAPHDQAACEDCHAGPAEDFAARYPGRDQDTCSACHEDPHGGQFAESPFYQQDCLGCHAREHFDPHTFDLDAHARARFVLDGSHAELSCEQCHERAHPDEPRTFRGTPARCEACHDDVHDGLFERREPKLVAHQGGTCSACHQTTTFGADAQAAFDHARWTSFALAGAHLQSACEACHPRAHQPDELGRSFGRVEAHFGGAIEGCASCHQDPHGGRFEGPDMPRTVEGRSGCARCHSETSFRAVTQTFEHRRWTGFPLEGAHGGLDCLECHPASPRRDEFGRSWGQARGSACQDCHADPHGGQFRAEGAVDCARCHSADSSFEALTFDHEKDARFPLGEAHRDVACLACHTGTIEAGGEKLVRYRPLKMECADCHGVVERPVLRRGGKNK